jgi:hypothetical protein
MNNTRILLAADGFVYCNGYTYGREIWMPIDEDATIWEEMTEAEAEDLILINREIEKEEEEV